MKKIKKILFPTDFSEPAANAFRYALLLADKMEADLEVLHIVFPEGAALDYPGMGAMLTQTKVESERIVLRKFIDNGMTQVLEQLKNAPNILTDIEVGTPVSDIVRVASRDNADLIIMGSRGTNRNRIEQMLGSIAAGVVARAKCPVLVVPEQTPFKAPLAIAYASNVSGADPYELWKSLQLLEVFKPMIHLVHLNFNKEGDAYAYQEMQDMEAFLESRSPETEVKIHNLPGKDLEEDLNHFIKKENIDLLVMYQPEHSIWDRLFGSSATKKMAVHTSVPLLVMKK
jgi:nucleotide-binding universal stress UspA family protein